MDALVGDVQPFSIEPELAQEEEVFNEEEKKFAQVGSDPKWAVIIEYVSSRVKHYRDDLADSITNQDDFTKIGQKAMACHLAAAELEALINKVETITKAVNDSKRESTRKN